MNKKKFKKVADDIAQLPEGKRELASDMLDRAIFQAEALDDLQKILKKKGWVEEYVNGKDQYGLKQSSEAAVYIQLQKNYLSTMKQIFAVLPDQDATKDELMAFLGGDID